VPLEQAPSPDGRHEGHAEESHVHSGETMFAESNAGARIQRPKESLRRVRRVTGRGRTVESLRARNRGHFGVLDGSQAHWHPKATSVARGRHAHALDGATESTCREGTLRSILPMERGTRLVFDVLDRARPLRWTRTVDGAPNQWAPCGAWNVR
jgi:hypothetical protein